MDLQFELIHMKGSRRRARLTNLSVNKTISFINDFIKNLRQFLGKRKSKNTTPLHSDFPCTLFLASIIYPILGLGGADSGA